jgi:hypothetical protein
MMLHAPVTIPRCSRAPLATPIRIDMEPEMSWWEYALINPTARRMQTHVQRPPDLKQSGPAPQQLLTMYWANQEMISQSILLATTLLR